MNPTSITLTALALAGALTSGYFWHQTGNQKAEQARVITELRSENKALALDGDSLRHQLANAEARSGALAATLKKDEEQRHLLAAQLADSRREMEEARQKLETALGQSAQTSAKIRELAVEIESLDKQLLSSVNLQQYEAVRKELAESKEYAKFLQLRLDQVTAPPPQQATTPEPNSGNRIVVSSGKSRLVPTKVRQVKDNKILLGYGSRQGAEVNANVRLQDGLDYLGFGRVIYVDESQCLVELNRGHQAIAADKDIFLLTPETTEKVSIKDCNLP